MKFFNAKGQATIEYVIVFAFMTLISVGVVRTMGVGLSTSVKTLAYSLSQELSSGICRTECFYTGYKNE